MTKVDSSLKAICPECDSEVSVARGRFVKHGQCAGYHLKVGDREGFKYKLESRFTEPREDCPHPDRWHSSDADSTEWEVTELVAAWVKALRPDVVVETGSAWGQTSQAIGQALRSGEGHLHTLEPDPERAGASRDRCKGLPVTVHEVPSLEWEPVDGIGFAWLDSLHALRVPEFRAFLPHMARGAFVGFHDTGPHQGALRDEILTLEAEGLLLPIFLPTPRGVCFAEVVA